jgi:hypothetical protein
MDDKIRVSPRFFRGSIQGTLALVPSQLNGRTAHWRALCETAIKTLISESAVSRGAGSGIGHCCHRLRWQIASGSEPLSAVDGSDSLRRAPSMF